MRLPILLLLMLPVLVFGQANLTGQISSEAGVPISGAEIVIKELKKGTYTKADGYYTFNNLPYGEYEVEAYGRGYASMTLTISISERSAILNFQLIKQTLTEDVFISSLRASEKTATTYSSLGKEQIAVQNFGQDFPFLLNQLPSTVVTSDAGAGIGYTGIRIRGSDPTRVNVTINGIPLNDPESHGTFWVNLPDLASSVNSVQVQRGVGTSTNGAGAFGASVNVQTSTLSATPYVELNNTMGSFNTLKNTALLGTGLMDNGFSFDARLSSIQSDGWVDRGNSDLRSWFVSGAYYGKKSYIKANVFSGNEVTNQSWWGVPEAIIRGSNREELDTHYFNNLGTTYQTQEDSLNLYNSGRQYNYYTYQNQVDNYTQRHYQLLYGYDFTENLNLSGAFHYTKGFGFFEEFREEDSFSSYPIFPSSFVVSGLDTLTTTDLIRRRWLDNDFFGGIFTLNYKPSARLDLTFGGGLNRYDGDHFGELIWARYAQTTNTEDRYYYSRGLKDDGHVYVKGLFSASERLTTYIDLQLRGINYSIGGENIDEVGRDNDQAPIRGDYNYLFFNPKVGITYQLNERGQFYTSLSVANREPVRSDLIDSPTGQEPTPETLYDVEAGLRWREQQFAFSLNGFYMYYQNQLVLTGQVNDVGANVRQNVDVSFRTGVEFNGEARLTPWLNWGLNFALSMNKIQDFTEIIYDYGTFPATEINNQFANTDIAFSPNAVIGSQLMATPVEGLQLALLSKYVGRQFLDNTSNPDRAIDAWFVNDFRINYSFTPSFMKEINIGLLVNNIFNEEYEANGYTFSYGVGDIITENFYYPQAGRNFLLSLGLRF